MKTCLICGTENASDALTCVACGEGSFGEATHRSAQAEAHQPQADDKKPAKPNQRNR